MVSKWKNLKNDGKNKSYDFTNPVWKDKEHIFSLLADEIQWVKKERSI